MHGDDRRDICEGPVNKQDLRYVGSHFIFLRKNFAAFDAHVFVLRDLVH